MKTTVAFTMVLLVVARVDAQTGRPQLTRARLAGLPMQFEPNLGQAAAPARFVTRGDGYALLLAPDEAVLVLGGDRARSALRMSLAGATRTPSITGVDESPGKVNYLIGSDRTRWRTNVATYAKVKYAGVYQGIDLLYYGNQADLEYDFVVAPGADPRAIRLRFEGAQAMKIEADGALLLKTATRDVRMRKPVTYQQAGSVRREIASRYVRRGHGQIGVEVGDYDHDRPLIIDPVLAYSTYFGGFGYYRDAANAIAVDGAGNAYVAGETFSVDFPTTAGALKPTHENPYNVNDAFITKLNASGTAVVYSTYLGGTLSDRVYGIAIDASGAAYVTGATMSQDFPTVDAVQTTWGGTGIFDSNGDVFVAKLTPDGSALVYSTYVGGAGGDVGRGIAVDAAGRAHVAGLTRSANFPVVNPAQTAPGGFPSAFIFELTPSGSAFVYSTYLSGFYGAEANAIATDAAGTVWVGGHSSSHDFPIVGGAQPVGDDDEGFLARFDASGALQYSSFLGGTGADTVRGVAIDAAGFVYVTGVTASFDFPVVNAVQPVSSAGTQYGDAFVAKLNPSGSAFVYSTYLGGSESDGANAIAADSAGNAYVTGTTQSDDFPTRGALQPTSGGISSDAFITQIDPAGSSLVFSTYLGGDGSDAGLAIALDAAGDVYVTGDTRAGDFPTTREGDFPTANPLQRWLRGSSDAFVAKITHAPHPALFALDPVAAVQGMPLPLTLSGLNFVSGATSMAVSGWGATAGTADVSSPTSLTTSLALDADAAIGYADVTVTTPQGTSNNLPVAIYSSNPACRVSLPVAVDGTPLDPHVHFGIGALEPTEGTWMLLLVIYDASGNVTMYGQGLLRQEFPAVAPKLTMQRSRLFADPPVLALVNAFFNPSLCAFNVALTPTVDPAEEGRLREVLTGLLGELTLPQ